MSFARRLATLLLFLFATSAMAGPTGVPDDLPDGLAERSQVLVAQTLGAPHTANFRKFGGFRLSDGGWAVCGEVNSRNLTGLAMGWKPVYLRFRGEEGGLVLARRIVDWPADVACRHLAMGRALRTRD
jgi:hypothetical protein